MNKKQYLLIAALYKHGEERVEVVFWQLEAMEGTSVALFENSEEDEDQRGASSFTKLQK